MSHQFLCPFLDADVELSDERERHIMTTHPGTLPNYFEQIGETLADPDQVRRSERDDSALLFSRWFELIRTGRYLVVVTISNDDPPRHWMITAYTARKLTGGTVIWSKD